MTQLLQGVWRTRSFGGKCLIISMLLSVLILAVVPLIVQAQSDDGDGDLIPDVFESLLGLDPTSPSDAGEDPDGDTVTNLGEYNAFSDPMLKDSDFDGLKDALDPDPLSSAMFYWGRPDLTDANGYGYIVPAWVADVNKFGGDWMVNTWYTEAPAHLEIQIAPSSLPSDTDFFLDIAHADIPGGSLSVDLVGPNNIVISDLSPELITGSDSHKVASVLIPSAFLQTHPTIHIKAEGGAVQVFESVLRPAYSDNLLLYPIPLELEGFCEVAADGSVVEAVFAGWEPVVTLEAPSHGVQLNSPDFANPSDWSGPYNSGWGGDFWMYNNGDPHTISQPVSILAGASVSGEILIPESWVYGDATIAVEFLDANGGNVGGDSMQAGYVDPYNGDAPLNLPFSCVITGDAVSFGITFTDPNWGYLRLGSVSLNLDGSDGPRTKHVADPATAASELASPDFSDPSDWNGPYNDWGSGGFWMYNNGNPHSISQPFSISAGTIDGSVTVGESYANSASASLAVEFLDASGNIVGAQSYPLGYFYKSNGVRFLGAS